MGKHALSPSEQAFARLLERGRWTIAELMDRTGYQAGSVGRLLTRLRAMGVTVVGEDIRPPAGVRAGRGRRRQRYWIEPAEGQP